MPREDGAGPAELRAGCCTERHIPDLMNPALDYGPGRHGRGRHGRRNRFRATGLTGCQPPSAVSREHHLELLKEQRKRLEGAIEETNKQIASLEAETDL